MIGSHRTKAREIGASAHLYLCIIAPYEIRKVDLVPEISVSRYFIFILLPFDKYLEYEYAVHTLIVVTRYQKFNFVSFNGLFCLLRSK